MERKHDGIPSLNEMLDKIEFMGRELQPDVKQSLMYWMGLVASGEMKNLDGSNAIFAAQAVMVLLNHKWGDLR